MIRQYNSPNNQDEFNNELETRMQEMKLHQSGCSVQKFKQRAM